MAKKTKKPKLTDKQSKFCEEYLIDLNASQAAIRAGYAAHSINKHTNQIVSNSGVQTELARLKAERSERTQITADNVVLELAKIGFSNIKNYVELEGDEVYFKDLSEIPDELTAAIESIKVMKKTIKGKHKEDDDVEIQVVQFKLHSKPNALEQLGKHLGIFKELAPHPESEKLRRAFRADEEIALRRLARIRTEELSNETIDAEIV